MKKAVKKLTASEEKTFEILEQAQAKFERYLKLSKVNDINGVLNSKSKDPEFSQEFTLQFTV